MFHTLVLALGCAYAGIAPTTLDVRGAASAPTDDPTWSARYADLARLERIPSGSPAFRELAAGLAADATTREREARKAHDLLSELRARTLAYHVARLSGATPKPVADPSIDVPWIPGEAWLALVALAPGTTRAQAAVVALAEAPSPERLALAARCGEEDEMSLCLDRAVRIDRAVHAYARDARSACDLARVLRAVGSAREALTVLDEAQARATEDPEKCQLLLAKARVLGSEEREGAAFAVLGAALALGSDAAALRLARIALDSREPVRARLLAGTLMGGGDVASTSSSAEARAIWGLSLLPTSKGQLAAAPSPRRTLP